MPGMIAWVCGQQLEKLFTQTPHVPEVDLLVYLCVSTALREK
jgi:hypothetical protein